MSFFDFFSGSKRKNVERFMIKLVNHLAVRRGVDNRREDSRSQATMGVRVTPLVEKGKPDRTAAFVAPTRDVSLEGISFVHRRQFRSGERLIVTIEFDRAHNHFLCEARHCSSAGWGLFLTGCAILEPVDETPELAV